jgi:hypothetical protein
MKTNKKISLSLFFLSVSSLSSMNAWWGRSYYYDRPYYDYGYSPYYDDSGAAIAGDVIGGGLALIGSGIAASETKKRRKAIERANDQRAQAQGQESAGRLAALEEQNELLRQQLADQSIE